MRRHVRLCLVACLALAGCDTDDERCTRGSACAEDVDASDPSPAADAAMDAAADAMSVCPGGDANVTPIAGRTVNVRIDATDFADLSVPQGLMASACELTDEDCESPRLDGVTPDPMLRFDGLPHAFMGYLTLRAPSHVDALVYSNRPFTERDTLVEAPTLFTPSTYAAIAEAGGEESDPSKGIVLVSIFDCEGNAAPGVRIEQSDGGDAQSRFYFEGSLPDRDRTTTTVSSRLTSSMTELALAGLSNVAPGYVSLSAVLDADDELIGKVVVRVRPSTVTWVELHAGHVGAAGN